MYNERDVYKQECELNELNEGHVPFGGIIKRFHRVYYVCNMYYIYIYIHHLIVTKYVCIHIVYLRIHVYIYIYDYY